MTKENREDEWWNHVRNTQGYPVMARLELFARFPFHGPQVESAFSVMGNILHTKAANNSVETYESYQAIKYYLKAVEQSATQQYSRKSKHDPVNVYLWLVSFRFLQSLRTQLRLKQQAEMDRLCHFHSVNPPEGKRKGKDAIDAAALHSRCEFQRKRLQVLKSLEEMRSSVGLFKSLHRERSMF